ncbi:MAG: DegT/DnrJ/EryC1/StrS family aminotransferase [Bacillota bacterium]|nr:DegT/DnrJ/EryC1/StrS family aminotransferase [Bacillota bacterium]
MERVTISKPQLGEEDIAAVAAVLRSGQLAAGKRVREFEDAFAAMIGVEYAVAASSGTAALQAALRALELPAGSLVITTPFSFMATAAAILDAGAVPLFVDIDPETYNLRPQAVSAAIDKYPGVQAIVAVDLYGLPFSPALLEISARHGLWLVEDAAQAHGASVNGRRAGALGHIACFSFYATKNMTTGEGGMVTTPHPGFARRVRLIINHGQQARYHHTLLGFNYRLTEMQAALGLVQLKGLADRNERRRSIAHRYNESLPDALSKPHEPRGYYHVYHQYVVRSARRDEIAHALDQQGIDTAVHYPALIPRQPAMSSVPLFQEICPVAERACREVLSLPVHAGLRDDEVDRVIDAVKAVNLV